VFSVALLPEATAAALTRFRRHAFAFVTDTRVSWRYDAETSALHTTFTAAPTSRDPAAPDAGPLLALYPHQWKNLGRDLGAVAYPSARGPMKLPAASFSIGMPFGSVLPVLPGVTGGHPSGTSGRGRRRLRSGTYRNLVVLPRTDVHLEFIAPGWRRPAGGARQSRDEWAAMFMSRGRYFGLSAVT
jgi:hypothetical protein